MIKCLICGNSNVRICLSPIPDWYDGDIIGEEDDYALCPKCGKVDIGDVKVMFERKRREYK